MTDTMRKQNQQTLFNFVVLIPIFLVFSLLFSSWRQGREMDFGVYWQAGHMILAGQDVYDPAQWETVRQAENIIDYPAGLFPYPLPLAVLFAVLGFFPLQTAYTLWMFLAQIAVLASIMMLLRFYPARSGYLELLAIAGILFFRPMFSLINSGQVLSFLLLALVLSIRLFHEGKWFMGGSILSVLSLKPSIGLPLFILTILWLVIHKRWKGIWGMIAGGLTLICIGALVNVRWVIDYLNTSDNSFQRFFGMQPTLWGVADKIFQIDRISLIFALISGIIVLVIEIYLLWRDRSRTDVLGTFASIVPVTLLVAPYMWNYDQILLAIPIIFLLIAISTEYGMFRAALFMLGVIALAFLMVVVAYAVGHDVWSFLNTFVIWLFSLYFVSRKPVVSTVSVPNSSLA